MVEDNKQQNKLEGADNKQNILSISDIAVFRDNPHLAYLYKKTEKLVSALYLLSNFISDKEPVKWQMREAGIELLSQSLSLSDRSSSERMHTYTNFVSTGLKFLSFLEVSYIAGIISEMNYNILKYEFESLIQKAEMGEKGNVANKTKGLVFPDNFFEVSEGHQIVNSADFQTSVPCPLEKTSPSFGGQFNKGQTGLVSKMSVRNVGEKPNINKVAATYRQDIIISLLKKNNELGIKDFTQSIKDCSEKTIQRELAVLVAKGQIKKEGEKRWSKYSLKV